MKKKIVIALLLCLVALLTACSLGNKQPETCKHQKLADTTYEPDCSLEGYIQHICLDCGHTYRSDIKEPTGHKMISVVTDPTCTAEGYTTYTCSVCDYTYKADNTEPFGHTFTSKITPQTCVKEGYTTYTCECGYSYKTTNVVPNGHNFNTQNVAPTCSEQGYTLYFCNNCDYSYKTEFTSSAHAYESKVTASTCTETGHTTYTCSVCGHSYKTNETAPLGHKFTSATVSPTFNTTGFTVYTCKCGFSYVGDYVWYSEIYTGIHGNADTVVARGIDLSYHNKTVNFDKLAKAGVDFVILRVGYSGAKDVKFEEYYAAAHRAGLDIGAYFYTYSATIADLEKDVRDLMTYISGKQFEYPIYLDIEDNAQKDLSRDQMMAMCTRYCEMLNEKQLFPGVYSYKNWIDTKLNPEQLAMSYDVWLAHYPNDISTLGENYYKDGAGMWQYTESGTVDGVTGDVDRNLCYKDYPSIIKKYGYNGYGS